VDFLARAVGLFSQGITCRRILSDNGPSTALAELAESLSRLDLKPIRTKPLHAETNGKAERFHSKNHPGGWAYVIAYQTSDERNRWLPRYSGDLLTGSRLHMALGGLLPQQCLRRC